MTRVELLNRRPAVNFGFEWHGVPFVGSLGFDRLLVPREVFLHCSKTTTELEAVGRDAAILISQLLQHGATFAQIRKSVTRDESGAPASLVGALLDEIEHVTAEECEGLLKK